MTIKSAVVSRFVSSLLGRNGCSCLLCVAVLVFLDYFGRIFEVFTINVAVTLEHGIGFMAADGLDDLAVQSRFAGVGHKGVPEVVEAQPL